RAGGAVSPRHFITGLFQRRLEELSIDPIKIDALLFRRVAREAETASRGFLPERHHHEGARLHGRPLLTASRSSIARATIRLCRGCRPAIDRQVRWLVLRETNRVRRSA